MLNYLARLNVAFYAVSVASAVVAVVWLALVGKWGWALVIVAAIGAGTLQYVFAKWWLRIDEANDVQEWLEDNPDHGPDE